MSPGWDNKVLLEPISADAPCGKNLEDTDMLSAFDAYQIFGQTTLEPEKKKDGDPVRKEPRKSDRPPNWAEIRDGALSASRVTKDLRVLAHLGAAILRTDGIAAFAETLGVAANWLAIYPTQVFPLADEDWLFRQSAMNCFSDPVAVVDGLRRMPLVSSRQHGRFSLRDVEILSGQVTPTDNDARPEERQVNEAFADTPLEDLKSLLGTIDSAVASLGGIDAAMREGSNGEFTPSFEQLMAQFKKMAVVIRAQVANHPSATPADGAGAAAGEGGGAAGQVVAVGAIKSRQDAIRALDAAAEFFRRNEPSSPIPMFLDRAKRLVSKDFLEVLADVAPEALPQARSAGGIRDDS
jgi:type VI secretion system protein ImpA